MTDRKTLADQNETPEDIATLYSWANLHGAKYRDFSASRAQMPFALRRAPAVSEALAEGMTVMDYAPNSTVAEDFGSLAGWVKSLAAPASTGCRGVCWSER
jgi:cellulose biosynthesis protein BcsQ